MTQALPHTVDTLAADLRALGLSAGDMVLVHSSIRAVGPVAGGVQAVVEALLDVLGPAGTLIVPTHTPANSDPAEWSNPPVPEAWWPVLRGQSPGFDPARTPSQWMGVLPEVVRAWPGAVRSAHPHVSFAAVGAQAVAVTEQHPVEDGLGERSPLGALYRAYGKVLLLGCGHGSNTSLHLAECRRARPVPAEHGAAVRLPSGGSRWVTWTAPEADSSDFEQLGAAYEAGNDVRVGRVGNAETRLMAQRPLVDFATAWLDEHRS
ncbi:AAC(3) family N-acetyltransferase [Paractinoplanes abujensis]|uniref:Aminoglycoside N(3)-acetyltransferase n=1 Tax=Paractinoplanes abujensis TaxID=882441 RepID=A0A7W7CUF9_9ACTN|nr:AAC(3) family N-acetyltransferase [Actinoplanes abujensis]MBB4693605.1 aminoglycoside 3-N-acetyltransferase [Actinoplanes abujensis]GID21736.1 AAC(3) family N-acetyltransferase [Actinoplanes abujensis]